MVASSATPPPVVSTSSASTPTTEEPWFGGVMAGVGVGVAAVLGLVAFKAGLFSASSAAVVAPQSSVLPSVADTNVYQAAANKV